MGQAYNLTKTLDGEGFSLQAYNLRKTLDGEGLSVSFADGFEIVVLNELHLG